MHHKCRLSIGEITPGSRLIYDGVIAVCTDTGKNRKTKEKKYLVMNGGCSRFNESPRWNSMENKENLRGKRSRKLEMLANNSRNCINVTIKITGQFHLWQNDELISLLSSLVAASQFSTSFNSTRVVAQRWSCVSSLMALLSFETANRIFNITNCANITMKRIKKGTEKPDFISTNIRYLFDYMPT
ncbi:hypothetical protein ALC60_14547 [Trachymyrmex zeteki]|uniref:Uncharacterized protein n=1 Tax=Mycetomoellerius zeteki TaxID=64791 RepID=A0A151WF64_9HYME|nr:hypothetical protein ALC60_14547 [Trachymyrmex zeteki]